MWFDTCIRGKACKVMMEGQKTPETSPDSLRVGTALRLAYNVLNRFLGEGAWTGLWTEIQTSIPWLACSCTASRMQYNCIQNPVLTPKKLEGGLAH